MVRIAAHLVLFAAAFTFVVNGEWGRGEAVAGTPVYGNLPALKQALAAEFGARAESFTIGYKGDRAELSDELKRVVREALDKDEYTAYIVDSYFYSIRSWGKDTTVKFTVTYRETAAQTAEVDRRAAEVLREIVTPGMNAHRKVKVIHDWIVRRVAYDLSFQRYTAYEALEQQRAVCQGYALLAYKMLNAAGVTTRIAEGSVSTGDHAWNLVQLDGQWYHLDLTWDDPVPDGGQAVSYAYYLKTDAEMRRDHSWTKSYPAAVTDYAVVLAGLAASDSRNAGLYRAMENDLGYVWLKPENIASTPAELTKRVGAALKAGLTTIKLRYTDGSTLKRDVREALSAVEGVRSYRYGSTAFGSDGSVLLELSYTTGG